MLNSLFSLKQIGTVKLKLTYVCSNCNYMNDDPKFSACPICKKLVSWKPIKVIKNE